ncbi:MAG TPA: MFS transporter, partial [Ilumatobacteraceae bacterium]|nr:MFS transporter [Ilumatobacteraceae bacterium]
MEVVHPRNAAGTTLALASPSGRMLVAALVLGSSAAFLYASVVNVALPAIGDDLDVGLTGLQWVVNGYAVAMAALILVGGSAGDVLGRRRVYVVSCAALVAGSVVCLAAPTIGVLVAGRLVQGVGAAGVTPISLALVDASFAEDERGRAIGLWASGSAITTAGGPFVGGVLVDSLGWRWVFALGLPLLVVSAAIVARLVPAAAHDIPSESVRRF